MVYLILVENDFVLSHNKPSISSHLDAAFYSEEVAQLCKERLESASTKEFEEILYYYSEVMDDDVDYIVYI